MCVRGIITDTLFFLCSHLSKRDTGTETTNYSNLEPLLSSGKQLEVKGKDISLL